MEQPNKTPGLTVLESFKGLTEHTKMATEATQKLYELMVQVHEEERKRWKALFIWAMVVTTLLIFIVLDIVGYEVFQVEPIRYIAGALKDVSH